MIIVECAIKVPVSAQRGQLFPLFYVFLYDMISAVECPLHTLLRVGGSSGSPGGAHAQVQQELDNLRAAAAVAVQQELARAARLQPQHRWGGANDAN